MKLFIQKLRSMRFQFNKNYTKMIKTKKKFDSNRTRIEVNKNFCRLCHNFVLTNSYCINSGYNWNRSKIYLN